MKLSRAIPAGVLDAGLASLATFVINLYAIATWETDDPTLLGIYFLFMTAFIMASTISQQLLYVPAEKLTLDAAKPARLALYGPIARLGVPVGIAAALLVGLAAIVGSTQGRTIAEQAPFLITAGVATVFSPLQNHARRLLHLAGRSWAAAAVSLVQLLAAAAALLAILQTSIASEWIPIGSLAVANVVSVTTATAMIMQFVKRLDAEPKASAAAVRPRIRPRELAPSGRWLVGSGAVSTGNNFLVESAVALLAGAPALALAGSAKTVAQPILVLASGLRSVLGPPSMEAAKNRNRKRARRVARTFYYLMLAAVAGYSLIVGFDWVLNPLSRLIDQAYSVAFLVVLTIGANGLNGAAFPGRLELIGANREKQLFGIELRANIAQLAIAVAIAAAAGSAAAGSFARPVAFAVLGAARIVEYERSLSHHYRSPADDAEPDATIRSPSDSPIV